jgi:hypothetical protein
VGGCGAGDQCAPRDPNQFANYAAAAVNRYKHRGSIAWEIWNEPNTAGAWAPTPSPAAYTSLLRATSAAIKRADSHATVITGGLGVTFTENGDISPEQFVQGMYAAGARPYFDAVAQHAYSFPAPPALAFDWTGWTQMLHVRGIMMQHGDSNKLLWITEYGAPTAGPGGIATTSNYNFDGSPDHVDEALQAFMATQAVALYKTYPWAGPFFWYGYKDLGTSSSSNENFFGLVRSNGTHKPAYDAFVHAIAH